jgi:hypothetical protein
MPDPDQRISLRYTSQPDVRTRQCPACGHRITVTRHDVLRIHGHPARRCPGSGSSDGTKTEETTTHA